MQQGRVVLDRDFNALREIVDRRDREETLDIVGPCGTPDDGFAVRPHWHVIPLLRRLVLSPPLSPPAEEYDLQIGAGTMYVGGLRVEWPATVAGAPTGYSYFSQPDWLFPHPAPAPSTEIVWLQLDEHEVSATEDPDLLDAALGGPDTTQRLRLLRTVRRAAVDATTCQPAWQALQAQWLAQGYAFDAARMRRLPQARLQVAFTAQLSSGNPCDPIATGGYLGAENQLIRVKWTPPAARAANGTLLWGYDDASFIYRATSDQTGTRLSLARTPPDAYHFPGSGQYVEVLRTTALLGAGADQQAEQDGVLVPRCVAEETGFVTTLAAPYDPTASDNALVLSQPLPAAYLDSTEPLFVRIWQGGGAMAAGGGTMELVDPVANASTGLVVTLTVPGGTAIAAGSFWLMALRPATPQSVLPAALLAAPQPPDGPHSWACPLAVVQWPGAGTAPVIDDCRVKFDDLVALTQRPRGCCTASLSPDDITIDRTLQSVLNGLSAPGTLCLAPGTYTLAAPLRLGAAQTGLSIVAENGATLMAATGTEAGFGDGLIVVAGAQGVTLRGLTLVPPATAVPAGLLDGLANLVRIGLPAAQDAMAGLLKLCSAETRSLTTMIGIRAAGCELLTVAGCTVRFPGGTGGPAFGIGLFAAGDCARLAVRGCRFDATALPPTQSPALSQALGFPGAGGFVLQASGRSPQGAIGCLASPGAARFLDPAITDRAAIDRASIDILVNTAAVFDTRNIFTTVTDLSGAAFEDNVFDSVILAVSAHAMLDGVRVAGNRVVNSTAGVWLRPLDSLAFFFATPQTFAANAAGIVLIDPVVAGDSMWLKLVQLQQETFLPWVLGLLLPPPAGAVAGRFAAATGGATMRIAANSLGALAGLAAGAPPLAPPALAVVTDTYLSAVDTGPGLIVEANRVQARTLSNYPAAVLAVAGRLGVTGNLISNEPSGSPPAGLSLQIFPDGLAGTGSGSPAPRICVTGNVLEGASNLGTLLRTDATGLPQGLNTWLPFNASA